MPGNPAQTTYAKASAGNIENGLSFMRINSPTQQQQQASSIDLGTSPLATFIASNNLAHLKAPQPGDANESQRQQSEPQLQALLKKPVPVSVSAAMANNVGQSAQNNTTPGKPAAKLMPPTMFETTANETIGQRTPNAIVKGAKNENIDTNKKNSMPKGKEIGNQKSRKKSAHEQQAHGQQNDDLSTAVQPLTETQLLQAISYLMKNDPSFIRKIHEAYLKSFAEMVSQ